MGGLIPTPNDLEVVAKLNLRFSSSGLTTLRNYQTANADRLFAPGANRTLERVSVRLGIYPTLPGGRGRWLHFLQNILKPANGNATYNLIKTILDNALSTANVDSVVFNILEDPTAGANNYYLYPSNAANAAAPQQSNDHPVGKQVYLVTLVCPSAAVIPHGVEPAVDPGEPATPLVP